ncbi:hypothetical protein ACQ4WX_00725 [Streptomyces lasalocidi]
MASIQGYGGQGGSRRARSLTRTHPAEVSLQDALNAVADPVRRTIIREPADASDGSRACGTFDLPVSRTARSHPLHRAARRGADRTARCRPTTTQSAARR